MQLKSNSQTSLLNYNSSQKGKEGPSKVVVELENKKFNPSIQEERPGSNAQARPNSAVTNDHIPIQTQDSLIDMNAATAAFNHTHSAERSAANDIIVDR